jgi:hypothetical protein
MFKLQKIIFVSILFFSLPISIFAFQGGDGLTAETAYEVSTCLELQSIAEGDLSAYYKLIDDIECAETTTWNNGSGFFSIGSWNQDGNFPFTGHFDGNNFEIRDLYMHWTGEEEVYVASSGLFGYTEDATIKNVSLVNVDITNTHDDWGTAGGLISWAQNDTFIENVFVQGSIEGNYVGGLIAYIQSDNAIIEDSHVDVSISVVKGRSGGFIGELTSDMNFLIKNSSSTGSLTTIGEITDSRIGGFVGYVGAGGVLFDNVYSTMDISSNRDSTGGLIGDLSTYGLGEDGVEISNSYFTGNIYMLSDGGENNINDVGGFIGRYNGQAGVIIDNSYVESEIDFADSYTGGFIGRILNSSLVEINQSYFKGKIQRSGIFDINKLVDNVGGFLGGFSGNTVSLNINDSYVIVDFNLLENEYTDGNLILSGFSSTGKGLNLINFYAVASFLNYPHDSEEISVNLKPFISFCEECSVVDTFYYSNLEYSEDDQIAILKEENLIKNILTFTDTEFNEDLASSWDFDDVWDIAENRNTNYPYLRWQIFEEEEEPILGCTDPSANNYDSEAGTDDDSCTYTPAPTPTPRRRSGGGIASSAFLSQIKIATPIIQANTTTENTNQNNTNNIPDKKENTENKFTRTLRVGMRGEDVRDLQRFLNNNGFNVANTGLGSKGQETDFFGRGTFNALIRFQNANRQTILAPLGITNGTGVLGPSTVKFINSLN